MPCFVHALPVLRSLRSCGCVKPAAPPVAVAVPLAAAPATKAEAWQRIASAADIDRIRRTNQAWTVALGEARARGFRSAVAGEGDLLKPAAALARPAPTPGSYNCRLIKLGNTNRRGPAFEKFKPFFCYVEVENNLLTIVKQTGTERPAGRLWEDDNPYRLIYLGSLALGDEADGRGLMATTQSATWPGCSNGSGRSNGGW